MLVAEAALILAAGYLLSRTGSIVAERTGLGSAFFGATFIAVATSLPEISTMVSAVRLRRYEMALGDIFGTNLFNGALIFLIDVMAPGAPALNQVGAFSAFGSLLGLVLTAIFLAGVLERRDRTIFRMGWDFSQPSWSTPSASGCSGSFVTAPERRWPARVSRRSVYRRRTADDELRRCAGRGWLRQYIHGSPADKFALLSCHGGVDSQPAQVPQRIDAR